MPPGPRFPGARPDVVRGRLAVAAALTLAAGVVHVAAAVPHFGDDPLLGSAFTITGWAQIVVAALLLRRRPVREVVWAGLVTHVVALGALVVARTVGLPLGHGGVEPMTVPDATTAALEAAAMVPLVGWLRRPHRIEASRPVVLGTLAAAGLVALAGSMLAVASLGTDGHAHAPEPADAHAAEDPHGQRDAAESTAARAAERIHLHEDASVHVHAAGDAHEHSDGTVHVHAVEPGGTPPAEQPPSGAHTHAPGEGHG